MNDEPNFIRRAVLLIETTDGLQHGYQIHPCDEARISWFPEQPDYSNPGHRIFQMTNRGSIYLEGTMTGMVKMPTDVFDDAEIEAARPELPRGGDDGR